MAVDNEFISRNSFNTKFKNYLRDIYVYQFKNKDFDFYDTGNFSRSRLVAALIACKLCNGIDLVDFYNVKMKDIEFSDDGYVSVTFTQKKDKNSESETGVTVRLGKPWSEMFGYLYISKPSFYFLTGTKGSFQKNKTSVNSIDDEEKLFQKGCPSPRTTYKMYRYWSEIYLREANENIASSTYDNDFKRLRNLVGEMAGVEWTVNSQSPDYNSGEVTDNNNDWVECVTADTREMSKNPFHSLYRNCNRYSNDTDYFNILFALFMYFNLGKNLRYNESIIPKAYRDISKSSYDRYIKKCVAGGNSRIIPWSELNTIGELDTAASFISTFDSENTALFEKYIEILYCAAYECEVFKDDERVPGIVCELLKELKSEKVYLRDPSDISDNNKIFISMLEEKAVEIALKKAGGQTDREDDTTIELRVLDKLQSKNYIAFMGLLAYLITDRKRLMFDGQDFLIVDSEYVEMSMLYAALSRFLNCGKKQFTNIVGDICKTGAFRESNRIRVVYDSKNYNCIKDKKEIENALNAFENCFELVEEVKGYSYHIYYSKDIDNDVLEKLKECLTSEIGLKVIPSRAVYVSMSDCNLNDVLSSVEKDVSSNNRDSLIQRFSEMVSFFSQTSVLGEIGSYVSDRLPEPKWKILYKHNYIVKALNDYSNIDLLYAMQNPVPENHYWVEIGARDPLDKHGYLYFTCYPIQLHENVTDGKQYLIYYHPKYRSIDSIRVDFIDSVIVGSRTKNPDFDGDIERAYKLIDKTWGLDFCDFYEGNVKSEPHPSKVTFTVSFARKNKNTNEFEIENFIKSRIMREIGSCTEKQKSEDDSACSLLEITVEVVNPWAMLNWLRSYTRRIDGVKIEYDSYMDDIARADNKYSSMKRISGGNGDMLSTAEPVDISLLGGKNKRISASDTDFTPVESKSDLLFNEFYCKSFGNFGTVLEKIFQSRIAVNNLAYIRGNIKKKNKNEKDIYDKFLEKFLYNAYIEQEDDSCPDNRYAPYFSLLGNVRISSVYDLIPLTHIEIQWLRNILDHNQARGFLTKKEIDAIKAKLPEMSVFDVNSVVLQDKHSDKRLEAYYEKIQNGECALVSKDGDCALDFSDIVRTMMEAINKGKTVKIKYMTQYGTEEEHTVNPYCIEYSKRDNRFRVLAFCWEKSAKEKGSENYETLTVGKVYTYPIDGLLNVDNVICSETESELRRNLIENAISSYNKENKKTIVVFFPDINGIPDRILTEFSCYKKTCIKWGNGTYKMTLEYLKEDCMEIVIRLLGYGSLVTVKSADSGDPVVKELTKRYHEQVELYREKYRYIGEHETEPERKSRKVHENRDDREEMER